MRAARQHDQELFVRDVVVVGEGRLARRDHVDARAEVLTAGLVGQAVAAPAKAVDVSLLVELRPVEVRTRHLPWNSGRRFSMNARMTSTRSSVAIASS